MKKLLNFILLVSIILMNFSTALSSEDKGVNYLNMGSHFIENKGQWPDNVKYLAVSGNYRTWITDKSLVFDVPIKYDSISKVITNEATYLDFVEADLNKIEAFNKKELILNYFIGNQEITGVRVFDSIYVTNVFDNIDLNLRFEEEQLRYDFIVNEGADPNQIQMKVSENCKVINNGENLIFETEYSIIKNAELKTFQKSGTTTNKINSNFSFDGNKIRFSIDNYNKSKKLIIDPIIKVKTIQINGVPNYGISEVKDIHTQKSLSTVTIFVGHTMSDDFPYDFGIKKNGFDGIFGEMKKDINNDLITPWITFFGGSDNDYMEDVDVEKDRIYITGKTGSDDIPITLTTAYQTTITKLTNNDDKSNFFCVFSLNGQNSLYSTYLRNYYNTGRKTANIDVTEQGRVYLTGTAHLGNYLNPPFSQFKAIQSQTQIPHTDPNANSFIMSFDEVLNSNPLAFNVRFSSFFGGTRHTIIKDMVVNRTANGTENIYITGKTYSTDTSFYTTPGAYKTTKPWEDPYMFFTKLYFDGNNLIIDYNSYFAKDGNVNTDFYVTQELEGVNAIEFANNRIYIGGSNTINSIPILNAFDNIHNGSGNMEAFISTFELNGNGTNDLVYSSYFGGSNNSSIEDLDYRLNCDRMYFSGFTHSKLDNYKGILNNNCNYYINDAYVGSIDIDLTGKYTLTELAYIPDYNFAMARAIDAGSIYNSSPPPSTNFTSSLYIGGFISAPNTRDVLLGIYDVSSCVEIPSCVCDFNTKNNLFSIDITKEGGTCSTDECYLENFFQMPINTQLCYTHITYSAELNGVVTQSPTTLPIVNNTVDLSQFNRCIAEGQEYKITIKLLEGLEDESPCEFTQTAYCPIADDRSYCVPDCESDVFNKYTNITIPLPSCPDCDLSISYSARIACNGNYDIRIDGLEVINKIPANPYNCSFCGFSDLYELAINQIILENKMGFEPNTKDDPCSSIYRVIEASCWTDVSTFTFGGPTSETPISVIQSFIPCESNCCGISLTVCRVDDDKVHITNNGPIYFDEIDCEGVYEDIEFQHYDPFTGQPYPSSMSVPCEPRCEEFVAYTGGLVVAQLKAVNENKGTNDYLNKETLNISAKSDYSNNKITVNYLANLETTSIIELYTIEGNILKSIKISPSPSNQSIEIDCNDLNNGVYFINVKVSGLTIHENKIIKVK